MLLPMQKAGTVEPVFLVLSFGRGFSSCFCQLKDVMITQTIIVYNYFAQESIEETLVAKVFLLSRRPQNKYSRTKLIVVPNARCRAPSLFTAAKYKNPLEYNFMCLAERGLGQQQVFGTRFSK